ncbi:MAG: hypothetical protein JWP06_822 [Candidatus Saccharibacteria bacterium]|nr:hypothetical protein [Candidatus Saccharibacteria bacterium]
MVAQGRLTRANHGVAEPVEQRVGQVGLGPPLIFEFAHLRDFSLGRVLLVPKRDILGCRRVDSCSIALEVVQPQVGGNDLERAELQVGEEVHHLRSVERIGAHRCLHLSDHLGRVGGVERRRGCVGPLPSVGVDGLERSDVELGLLTRPIRLEYSERLDGLGVRCARHVRLVEVVNEEHRRVTHDDRGQQKRHDRSNPAPDTTECHEQDGDRRDCQVRDVHPPGGIDRETDDGCHGEAGEDDPRQLLGFDAHDDGRHGAEPEKGVDDPHGRVSPSESVRVSGMRRELDLGGRLLVPREQADDDLLDVAQLARYALLRGRLTLDGVADLDGGQALVLRPRQLDSGVGVGATFRGSLKADADGAVDEVPLGADPRRVDAVEQALGERPHAPLPRRAVGPVGDDGKGGTEQCGGRAGGELGIDGGADREDDGLHGDLLGSCETG